MRKYIINMKTICATVALIIAATTVASAQESIGTNNPDASSALDITSVDKGFLMPRMTSAQRIAIVTPASGLQVYDTTTKTHWYFDGTVWVENKAVEPWYGQNGTPGDATDDAGATLNTEDIYQMGNVGIGTTNPTANLHIQDDALAKGYFYSPAGKSNLELRGDISTELAFKNIDGTTLIPESTWTFLHSGNALSSNAEGNDFYLTRYFDDDSNGINDPLNVMTFDIETGNVGIGTVAPQAMIHAYSAAGGFDAIIEANAGNADVTLVEKGDIKAQMIYDIGNDGISFKVEEANTGYNVLTSPSRLFIEGDGTGNVGIGTTSPSNKLHVTAAADPLKLEGLQSDITATSVLVENGGVVKTQTIATLAAANEPWFGLNGTPLDDSDDTGATSNTENIYMTGNIGVGTSTLSAGKVATFAGDVDIQGVLDPTKIIFSGDGSIGSFDPTTDSQYQIEFQEGNDLHFKSNTTDNILHLENTGNIGVGKSTGITAGVDIVPANGIDTGIQTEISHTDADVHTGLSNIIKGSGTGSQRGISNYITNSSDGEHHGISNILTGNGIGDKYGTFNRIAAGASGKHYAVYGEALKSGADIWAGYFDGKVAVTDLSGTSETSDVIVTADASTGELRSTSLSDLLDETIADKIIFSAEYAGAVFQADGTDNSIDITTNNSGAPIFMNYYEVSNYETDGNTNDYDVVLRFTLPADFESWSTATTAMVIDFEGTGNASFVADVYEEGNATVLQNNGAVSGTGLGSFAESDIALAAALSALTAGDTGIILIKLSVTDVGAQNTSIIRIGDITLNYNKSKY